MIQIPSYKMALDGQCEHTDSPSCGRTNLPSNRFLPSLHPDIPTLHGTDLFAYLGVVLSKGPVYSLYRYINMSVCRVPVTNGKDGR